MFCIAACVSLSLYECEDVLDGFLGPGGGCWSDSSSERVPGQILARFNSCNLQGVVTPICAILRPATGDH